MVRDAGATEVHMRISCPPTTSSCYYGVDTPERRHLIAARKSVEEVREFIGADSLAYLSLEGLRLSCGEPEGEHQYCTSCYTGKYPTPVSQFDVQEIRPAAVLTE
jgi:amidophosphoribosyltransferase